MFISASFLRLLGRTRILLERGGTIRFGNPGGAFFKREIGYETLEKKIEELLAESEA